MILKVILLLELLSTRYIVFVINVGCVSVIVLKSFTDARALLYVSIFCVKFLATILQWRVDSVFATLQCMSYYASGLSVCASVCPSVRQTRESWRNERNFCARYYTILKIEAQFCDTKNNWRGRPLLPEIFGKLTHPLQRLRFSIYSLDCLRVTLSEKLQLWLIGCSLRAFQGA